jgi:translation initiation factor 1A
MQKKKYKNNRPTQAPTGPIRVRLPKEKEVIGILEQRVGAGRMLIKCMDGKTRNCRVLGKLKKRLWLREGDVVLVKIWEFDESRGDIIFKYNPTTIQWLKRNDYLKTEESEF